MEKSDNPEVAISEQQNPEYLKNIKDSIDSGELDPIVTLSKTFKIEFAAIIKEAKDEDEAVKKIGELIIEKAKNIDISTINALVDKPYLFQALFLARKKYEGEVVIEKKAEWSKNRLMTATEGNETGALLQSLCLAYLSRNLVPEAKNDFITTSVKTSSTNDIGMSVLSQGANDAIYNKIVTAPETVEEIRKSAEVFLKAAWAGKGIDPAQISGLEEDIKFAFGEFYAEFGNRVHSFLNSIIEDRLFNCSKLEEKLRNLIRLKDEEKYIHEAALKVIEYYTKQLGMSEAEAEERLALKYNGLKVQSVRVATQQL